MSLINYTELLIEMRDEIPEGANNEECLRVVLGDQLGNDDEFVMALLDTMDMATAAVSLGIAHPYTTYLPFIQIGRRIERKLQEVNSA